MFTIDQKDLPDRLKSYTMLDGTPIPNYIVVDIINAAIEAGLVSPPCWETKFTDFKSDSVFKEKDDAIRHARQFINCEVRHWKGQTE